MSYIGGGQYSEFAKLAVFSTRILFEFDPHKQAVWDLEAKLVEGHMRIAYSALAHRECYRSGTPSEPILAEAVAQEMDSWVNQRYQCNIFWVERFRRV